MGSITNFAGGNSIWWILVLLLILNDGQSTCDSLIWILLLSRFCGNDESCGCGCGGPARTCGCGA